MSKFSGTFEHNLDNKNRFFVPAKFREILGSSFYARVKLAGYPRIQCFASQEAFEKHIEREISQGLAENPTASFERLNLKARACSSELTIDAHGRICVPSKMLDLTSIEKESVFSGQGDYFEIWNSDMFDSSLREFLEEEMAADAARKAQEQKRNEYLSKGLFLELKNTLGVE